MCPSYSCSFSARYVICYVFIRHSTGALLHGFADPKPFACAAPHCGLWHCPCWVLCNTLFARREPHSADTGM